jgi:photosystem II stability/assembly factor-like uncharacterized protein
MIRILTFLLSICVAESLSQQQWEFMGLGNEKITTLAVDPRNPKVVYAGSYGAGGAVGIGGIFRSTNGGLTWDTVAPPASVSKIVIHPSNSNIVYAALNSSISMRPGIVKSTDAGSTWLYADSSLLHDELGNFQGIALDPQFPETLYCGEAGVFPTTLWKSTTGGRLWFPSDSGGISNNSTGEYIVIDPESTNIVYASTSGYGGGVWKTTNGGVYWFDLKIPWNSGGGAGVLEMDPHDPATLYAIGPAVAKTTNKGVTWQMLSFDTIGVSAIGCLAFAPDTPNVWYAGSVYNVYRSSNAGINWQLMNPSIQGLNGQVLALGFASDGSTLYAGSWGSNAQGSGVYRYVFPTTTVTAEETVPEQLCLYQNFPNPFNPSTIIGYTVGGVRNQESGFSDVRLVVYDLLGREVAVLVNEKKAAGRYEVEFSVKGGSPPASRVSMGRAGASGGDARGLSSGIYFYRLTAGKFVETRKMVLLR